MVIMLGNLTLQQIQDRSGFQFPQEALELLQNRQEEVNRENAIGDYVDEGGIE